jgi:protein TonB
MPTPFRFALLESQRRSLLHAAAREVVGATFVGVAVAVMVAVQAWHGPALPVPEDSAVARWLAPVNREATPPPRQEHLEFIGLGGPRASTGLPVPASGDARRATAVNSSQSRGEATVLEEASETEEIKAYTAVEVDSTAILDPESVAPVYPPTLLKLGIEGVVMARFVVDSTGHVDLASFELLADTDPEFAAAVKRALPDMRYRPAVFGGKRVNQLAEQRFTFRVAPILQGIE